MPFDEIFPDKQKASKNAAKMAIRIVLEGRVQKVGLRQWIKQKATGLSVSGWVRNRTNGTVEAFFYGSESQVRSVVKMCYKGPSFAFIKKIKEFPQVHIPSVSIEFMILPTI